MPVLQLDDQQFPLRADATRLGGGGGVDVELPGLAVAGVQAVIEPAGSAGHTIRRVGDGVAPRVNGVPLGVEPLPLMHGDRIEIGGRELRFADDAQAGATQYVSASDIAALAGAKRTGAARATAASGGRLVSLMDGKEYAIPEAGLVIGRDAACDVVVAQSDVSRRHAEIAPDEQGYVVRDASANGVFVNGERVEGSHRLARADVVRVGTEEFRFYADVLVPTPAPAAAAAAAAPAAAPPVVPSPISTPATSGGQASPETVEPERPVLATLETLNEGPSKGTRFEVRTSLAHVGRGTHNDVRLGDESVSDSHAKLQRRDDGWYVVDMGSTNGTYVGGTRVTGERRLEGAPDVRFGGVKMRFTTAGGPADLAATGTRAISAVERPRDTRPAGMAAAPGSPRRGVPVWVWVVVALLVAGAAYFVLLGRA